MRTIKFKLILQCFQLVQIGEYNREIQVETFSSNKRLSLAKLECKDVGLKHIEGG